MEIGTYLRALLRRWWVVVLLSIVAAAGAIVIVGGARDTFTASVNLTVPPSLATTASANGQYVANFKVGLTTESVIDSVSSATGVSKGRLKSNLSASQVNNSSFISVSYNGNTQVRAVAVVSDATKATASLLAQGAIQVASTQVSAAQKALDDSNAKLSSAQQAINTYTAAHGYIDPNVLFQAAQSALNQLQVSKQQAIAQGHSTANFDTAIQNEQAQLSSLAQQVGGYDVLSRALNQAQSAVATAQTRIATASQDLALAQAPPLIDTPTVKRVTAMSTIIRGVAIAAGIGFVLGLALILLIEYIDSSRRLRRAADLREQQARQQGESRPAFYEA